ncbi:hypothetical protein LWI28_020895 [Acer negundo]|uniref:Uncharacterized protein n=1 Tax=Acer negundo TaxID=4023 RepID=A0AAD5J6P9_ACENE|nr:hypothetical protein LWI28_020895 [Acer negundo]
MWQGHGTETVKTLIAAILILVQISSPICLIGWEFWSSPPAKVVLCSPDTKVPRTGELALRKAIPANTNMKAIQASLADISSLLRIPQRKPYGTMEGNVKKALKTGRLTGRGTIELTIEKADGSTFSLEDGGERRKTATIQVALDGYSAPLTAGNFTKLVRMESCQFFRCQSMELLPWHIVKILKTTQAPYQFFFYLYDKRNVSTFVLIYMRTEMMLAFALLYTEQMNNT